MTGQNKAKTVSDHESNQLLRSIAIGAIIFIVFLSLPKLCSADCGHSHEHHHHDHDHGHHHDDHDHGHHHHEEPASFKWSRQANEAYEDEHNHQGHHGHQHHHHKYEDPIHTKKPTKAAPSKPKWDND